MGAAAVPDHHHRCTTKALQRPFKSRHASKGTLKDLAKGKVEKSFGQGHKSRHQQVMSKLDRRNQARQARQTKHKEHNQTTTVFAGQNGAPRIVAIVPLTEDSDPRQAVKVLSSSLDIQAEISSIPTVVEVKRFKQKLQYIPASRDLFAALDTCRIADFVVFVLSAREEVDQQGELLLKTIESQGVSNVLTVVQGLESVEPAKRRPQVATSLKSFITHFFPDQEKVHSLDSIQECQNVVRSLCTATPKGIKWREDRSWLLVDGVRWDDIDGETAQSGNGTLIIRGIVRGRGLKANRLLQLGDFGAFQINRITAAAAALRGKPRKTEEMDIVSQTGQEILDIPDMDQDDAAELAPEKIEMEDTEDLAASEAITEHKGVLLDDHHYFSDDEPQPQKRPKRLPKGTSNYQAAWYLDDLTDSGSDLESMNGDEHDPIDEPARPEDGCEGLDNATMRDATEAAPSEYPQSELFVDRSLADEAAELEAYRKGKKSEAKDDLEFPDEIELHSNVLARERLARYRGLKSLRTSEWNTTEDRGHQPEEWSRLLQVPDYKGAKARALREALVGGVQPGTKVDIYLRNVPISLKAAMETGKCLTAFSLLRHEHKHAVVNFTFSLSNDYPSPIKSKEELILQCGPRRFVINPLFSAMGSTPNNVHKFDRFVHPGRTVMATFMGPLTWGAVPALYFKRATPFDGETEGPLELLGTGTAQAPDQSRVIAKRAILTGHPYKIHMKVVTVRYMFFNTEDVRWFKALPLWTRRGRSGFIKESLGTHGYFKATFDAKINPQDSIGVSLYKRVFPKSARLWQRRCETGGSASQVNDATVQ